jgi:phosphatidylglycerophosphate synthase
METTRRPLTSRNTRWAAAIASFLAQHGVRPNAISVASVVFAAGAGLLLCFAGVAAVAWAPGLFVGAAVLMQFRLLCNLFDGMVAIEGGFKTKSGEIFNELPDRFADAFILIGAGYSEMGVRFMPWLGWAAAVLAVITAYVRALGASAGASQQFCGPMAKPHRMVLMTIASLATAVLAWMNLVFPMIAWALGLIAVGCLITTFRRTQRIIRELEAR